MGSLVKYHTIAWNNKQDLPQQCIPPEFPLWIVSLLWSQICMCPKSDRPGKIPLKSDKQQDPFHRRCNVCFSQGKHEAVKAPMQSQASYPLTQAWKLVSRCCTLQQVLHEKIIPQDSTSPVSLGWELAKSLVWKQILCKTILSKFSKTWALQIHEMK